MSKQPHKFRDNIYWYMVLTCGHALTLKVRGPSYLGLSRSISWLLMPWLLTSPGHQQPWYWLYRICRSFSYLRKCFKYLCQINVEEWHKMQIYVYVPSENLARKGLIWSLQVSCWVSVLSILRELSVLTQDNIAGANCVAASSSLTRPRHCWWKGPIQISCENFHRWRHYLKLVKPL